ncbi:glycosyltransferase family 2 protein [Pseudobacteroides cellulosolvens]|uniref:Glycosyl transferase family 2 n=1 Tax=Pseudobacteroides cellulosolvens ATCC 35603 = DSM 2933 TaxID=398512 RepID=A0A0L6JNJ5_9FIRM|nr:glycosyltransferase family 2 protein [Pseudobacteroides cellulosolvens]KNY27378.1 glycosyl transferase family 2 [Pseudobacteroides cellulosolvens ATCC 35603 = DSM 2933]
MSAINIWNKKILVIVPAFNEEKSIPKVISSLYESGHDVDLVVVDDGSYDNTSKIVEESGVKVLKLPYNLGIGGAVQTGYLYAKVNNYDIAIQLDGDGQHDPAYIGDLIAPLVEGRADMVIGSRYVKKTSYNSKLSRRIGMMFFSSLVTLLTGNPIKDTTSGFRAVNRRILEYFADNYPSDYPEVDVLVRLHKKKFKVIEIPVEMKERQGGTSSITPLKSAYYMIKVSIVLLINSIRSGALS